jgi:hypothetical protein
MYEDRKKVTPKPINKSQPKKRVEAKKVIKPKSNVENKTENKKRVEPKKIVKQVPKKREAPPKKQETTINKPKVKKSDDKYVRIALDATSDERKSFTDRVAKGELKLAYFAVENDKGYHYYLVIKN